MTVTLAHQPHGDRDCGYVPVLRATAGVDVLEPASLLAETEIRYSVPHCRGRTAQALPLVLQLRREEPLHAVAV